MNSSERQDKPKSCLELATKEKPCVVSHCAAMKALAEQGMHEKTMAMVTQPND